MKHRPNHILAAEFHLPSGSFQFAEGRFRRGGLRAPSSKLRASSGFFNPRILIAVSLCSCGVLLAMFSLAATPSVQTQPAQQPITNLSAVAPTGWGEEGSPITSSALPPSVPLPTGAQLGNSFNA